jgi:hypothetical protein
MFIRDTQKEMKHPHTEYLETGQKKLKPSIPNLK